MPAATRTDFLQLPSIRHPPSTIHHPPSIDSPSRDATLPPLQSLQASLRCHWLFRPSLAHAAHAGPVALASFGKAARGSVAGPELRRPELHAIGPMPSPPTGVFRRDVRPAAPLTNRMAMDSMALQASLALTLLLALTRADRGRRLFVGSVALGITDQTPGRWTSAGLGPNGASGARLHTASTIMYGAVLYLRCQWTDPRNGDFRVLGLARKAFLWLATR